jgi:hypothetical protein
VYKISSYNIDRLFQGDAKDTWVKNFNIKKNQRNNLIENLKQTYKEKP